MSESPTEAVLQLARDVLSEHDLDDVLGRVVDAAQELTTARFAALGVLDEAGAELARFLTRGVDPEETRRIGPLPTGHGVLGELIRDPVPLRVADVSRHHRAYGFPTAHPEMRSFLGVPIFIAGRAYGNLYLTEKAGAAEFTEDDERAVGLLAEFAGLAIDHARRLESAEQRRRGLERSVAGLDATVTIARTLAAQTDLSRILELVAKRGRALVSARTLVIELEEGSQLVVAAAAGEVPTGLIGGRVDREGSVGGAALRSARPERIEAGLNRARFAEYGLGSLGLEAEAGLVVPLVLRGRTYGTLVAVDRQSDGPEFTVEDEELLEAFAASAATAVATAKLFDAARHRDRLAAAEAERARWARELHDETLQGLSALRLSLAAMEGAEATAAHQLIEGAIADVEAEIEKLRTLIVELRPLVLDELGIAAAIEALAERLETPHLEVRTEIDLSFEEGRVDERHRDELETAVYRIVQEALGNAIKHADATQVHVQVVDDDDRAELRITVRDDGNGFEPARRESDGFGLQGIRDRVELLGGTLDLRSAPGEGTELRVAVPSQRGVDGSRARTA